MGIFDAGDPLGDADVMMRWVSCDLAFTVIEPAEIVLQVVSSNSAGRVVEESLRVNTNGEPNSSLVEMRDPHGARLHILHSVPGRLTVAYAAKIQAPVSWTFERADVDQASRAGAEYERLVYLRPSRYCPSDHLSGFAVAEFGTGPDDEARVTAITDWIRRRIGYVYGSSTVHDSAEHTLLTGTGTCRDFAHLGVALCRATGVPARFVAVYAPGLSFMDFHAVFEAFENGRWCGHDATALAPRPSMLRVATGRDAADAAFADVFRAPIWSRSG